MEPIKKELHKLAAGLKKRPQTFDANLRGIEALGDPSCTICGSQGSWGYDVPVGHKDFGKLFPCDCTLPQRMAKLQEVSTLRGIDLEKNIGPHDKELNPHGMIVRGEGTQQMIDAVFFAIERGWGLLLIHGAHGVGKTHALMSAVNHFIADTTPSLYIRMADLMEYIKAGFGESSSDDAQARLKRIVGMRVLCLDEIEKIQITEYADAFRLNFFDTRYSQAYREETLTICATNDRPSMLRSSVLSRFKDGRFRPPKHDAAIISNSDKDMRELLTKRGE